MNNKKPKHFIVLKIIGFIAIALAIAGIVLTFVGFGDFESNNFIIGSIMTTFGLFAGTTCLIIGFGPEFAKMQTKTTKYIQQQNKQDLTEIANTSADIVDEAITKTTKAIKEGLTEDKIFCKHCGIQIDADSKFCKKCGKEQ